MAEVNVNTPEGGTVVNPEGASNGNEPGVNTNTNTPEVTLPTTPEELQKMLQSETDRRVNQALEKAKLKWQTETQAELEAAKSEAAKLAKMTQDQKKEYELKQREDALALKEKELALRDMKIETINTLAEKKLPVEFADYLMADSAENTAANIDKFATLWQAKIEETVNQKLAGPTPKAGGQNQVLTKEAFDKMTYKELAALMEKDPALYNELRKK